MSKRALHSLHVYCYVGLLVETVASSGNRTYPSSGSRRHIVEVLPHDIRRWRNGSFSTYILPPDKWAVFVLLIRQGDVGRYLHIEMRYDKVNGYGSSPDPMLMAKKNSPPQAELVQRNWHWNTAHVDTNAYFLWKEYHHLTVPPSYLGQWDKWYIGVYNIQTVQPSPLKYDLRISFHNRRPCPRSCLRHGTCVAGHCRCYRGWADNDCSVPVDVLESGQSITTAIEAGLMRYHHIDVDAQNERVLLLQIRRQGGDPLVYVKASNTYSFALPTVQDYTFYYPIRWYGDHEQTLSVPISHFSANRWFIGVYNMDYEVAETSVCTVRAVIEDRKEPVQSLMISTVVAVAAGVLFLWLAYAVHRSCRSRRHGPRQLEIVLQSEANQQKNQRWRLEKLEEHFPAKAFAEIKGKSRKVDAQEVIVAPKVDVQEGTNDGPDLEDPVEAASNRPESLDLPKFEPTVIGAVTESELPVPDLGPDFVCDRRASTSSSASARETCAICLVDFEPCDCVRSLNCCHVFHRECIDEWLGSRHSQCPLCKRDFGTLLEEPGEDPAQANLDALSMNQSPGEPLRVTVTINPRRPINRSLPPQWVDTPGFIPGFLRVTPEAWSETGQAVPQNLTAALPEPRQYRMPLSPSSLWGLRPVWQSSHMRAPRE